MTFSFRKAERTPDFSVHTEMTVSTVKINSLLIQSYFYLLSLKAALKGRAYAF